MSTLIVVEEGQNIIDVCVQGYLDLEKLLSLRDDNVHLIDDLTQNISPGFKLEVIESSAQTPEQATYKERSLIVNTGDDIFPEFNLSGIGNNTIVNPNNPNNHNHFTIS
jgi:hypothetical protein